MPTCDKPARAPHDNRDHRDAEYEHAIMLEFSTEFGQEHKERGRNRDTDLASQPTEDDDRQYSRGLGESEAFGAYEALTCCEKTARESAEKRADAECGEFQIRRIKAERATRPFVLSQRFPCPAKRQASHAQSNDIGPKR